MSAGKPAAATAQHKTLGSRHPEHGSAEPGKTETEAGGCAGHLLYKDINKNKQARVGWLLVFNSGRTEEKVKEQQAEPGGRATAPARCRGGETRGEAQGRRSWSPSRQDPARRELVPERCREKRAGPGNRQPVSCSIATGRREPGLCD